MAGELRLILLAICVPLLVGIWWWETRRSRQAPGNPELREPAAGSPPPAPRAANEAAAVTHESADSPEWGVPPFEPLSIRTTDFEPVPMMDAPMSAHPDAMDVTLELEPHAEPAVTGEDAAADTSVAATAPMPPPREAAAAADTASTGAHSRLPNVSETQRIVSLRVAARDEARWRGSELLAALENHGLAFGRYQVFHRRHSDGRTLFCAASLVEPGTFDPSRMPAEEFRGLTLFAVLPGPADPLPTLDALLQTAAQLADALNGAVQDSTGIALSQQRALALREDVARFQALLTMS